MAKTNVSRLTQIYRAEKTKGRGLGSAIGKATLEKIDPRQFFNQQGLLAAIFPTLFKAYKAPTQSEVSKTSPTALQFSTLSLENKIDDLSTHAKISAKNSLVLPSMARDMNLTRQNIAKLVKLQGGKPSYKSDMFFMRAAEREATYESQFKKTLAPTNVTTKTVTGKEDQSKGFFGNLFDTVGNIVKGLGSAIGGVASGAGALGGGALSGLGSIIQGLITAMGAVTAAIITLIPAIIGLTTTILTSAGSKIADLAKVLLTPANLTILAGAVVAAIFAYGISKLLENMKEGEKQKDELSKLREKELGGTKLTDAEMARKKELESKGVTATTGEATRLATKSSMTLGTAQQLLSANLSDQEIKEQSGVSRKVLQEYVKQGGKTDTFTLSRQMGEEPVGSFTADTTARMTGDKGSMRGPQGQKLVIQNGVRGYFDTSSGTRVFTPFAQSPLNETSAETSRLARQPVIGTSSTTPTPTLIPATTPTQYPEQRFPGVTFGMLTRAQQDAFLAEQRKQEGFKPGSLTYDLNNPGAMLYGEIAKKYGAIQNPDRGVGQVKGKFAQFPTLEAGVEAQRELWLSSRYRNLPLDQAINLWTTGKVEGTADPKEAQSIANYKNKIYAAIGAVGDVPTTIASALSSVPSTASEALQKVKDMLPSNIEMPTMAGASESIQKIKNMLSGISIPSLGATESTIGNRLGSATIEVAQARVQIGSAPIVVAPPTVNVQAPQIQGGTGGFGAMASSSVVDTEFMKLLVGRTVTL